MEDKKKYDATYTYGNTIVHVVAPSLITEAQKQRILREMHLAGWLIIKKLVTDGKKV